MVYPAFYCSGRKISGGKKIEPMRIEQKTLTILVAEDNGSNFKLIESILGKDYHLLHAWNGKEAIELYREYEPQLLLNHLRTIEAQTSFFSHDQVGAKPCSNRHAAEATDRSRDEANNWRMTAQLGNG